MTDVNPLLYANAARAYGVPERGLRALCALVELTEIPADWLTAQRFRGDATVPENRIYLTARALGQAMATDPEAISVTKVATAWGVTVGMLARRQAYREARRAGPPARWRLWIDKLRQL